MNKVLVIVVTYNGMQWLQRCLSSVPASTVPADLYVLDNDSTDGSADFVAAHFPAAKLVRSADNLGFAAANNLGFEYALKKGYEYVYLLNQDAWLMPDTLEKLIAEAKANANWGILSPMQMKADMSSVDEQFRKHSLKSSAKPYSVKFVMAAHWLIPTSALRKTGLFSPAFTHYGEDNNLCDRMRWHGLRVGVVPTAFAVHDRASRPRPKAYRMDIKVRMARVALSNPNIPFWLEAVWQPLRLVAVSVMRLSARPLKALPALLKDYPVLKECRKKTMLPAE